MERVAEECARKSSSEINSRVLLWTLQSSDQDHELEKLFAIIPGFCNSRVFNDLLADFKASIGEKVADAVVGLMDRTLSSDLLPQSTKQSRVVICNRAMAEASLPINRRTLGRVLYRDWSGLLDSVEFGLMLRNARYGDPFAKYNSQCVISIIIARVQEHNDRWFELATGYLGISKAQSYLTRGDSMLLADSKIKIKNSMLLANCVFICRRTMEVYSKHGWRCDVYSRSKTLHLVSQLDIQEALPELQHEFCDMWNELVQNTRNWRSRDLSIYILKDIRNVYYGLHQGTFAAPTAFSSTTSDRHRVLLFPQSYPLCTIACHRPAKEPSPEDVPFTTQDFTPATPKTPRARQGGAYSPATPYPTYAASSPPFPQASLCSPGGTIAPPHNSDVRAVLYHFQLNHSSSSFPTPPIESLPSPATSTSQFSPLTSREGHHTPAATSSYAPLRLVCSVASGFGTLGANKDAWTPISTAPMEEVCAV